MRKIKKGEEGRAKIETSHLSRETKVHHVLLMEAEGQRGLSLRGNVSGKDGGTESTDPELLGSKAGDEKEKTQKGSQRV